MNPKVARAIEAVRKAFAKREYPGDDKIVPGGLRPPPEPGDCDDYYDLQEAFRGKKWQDVPLELMERFYGALGMMSDEAFCYYLPAYLIAALKDEWQTTNVQDFTVWELDLTDRPEFRLLCEDVFGPAYSVFLDLIGRPDTRRRKEERFRKLTAEERAAIREALEALMEYPEFYDASDALRSYWAREGRRDEPATPSPPDADGSQPEPGGPPNR